MFPSSYTGQILQRYPTLYTATEQEKTQGLKDLVHELAIAFEMPAEFQATVFMHFPVQLIIDYIRKTHRLYLFKKLPEMEQSIDLLLHDYTCNHPLLAILNEFYSSYKVSLSLHICEEEQHLLPYIDFLLQAEKNGLNAYEFFRQSQRYSLAEFEHDHENDTGHDLKQIRETILLYEPPLTNATPYRILLQQLHNFERDLTVHGLMEDQVLLPRLKVTENHLQQQYENIFRNN